jgi:hypothetical protein
MQDGELIVISIHYSVSSVIRRYNQITVHVKLSENKSSFKTKSQFLITEAYQQPRFGITVCFSITSSTDNVEFYVINFQVFQPLLNKRCFQQQPDLLVHVTFRVIVSDSS